MSATTYGVVIRLDDYRARTMTQTADVRRELIEHELIEDVTRELRAASDQCLYEAATCVLVLTAHQKLLARADEGGPLAASDLELAESIAPFATALRGLVARYDRRCDERRLKAAKRRGR